MIQTCSVNKRRVCIDGNIGSGKSTQVQKIAGALSEPIDEWPLELFYKDSKRWGFLLQMSILRSFMDMPSNVICERSPESSVRVFWKMLREECTVTEEEDKICRFFYERYGWSPDIHIYIRTSPETCFKRLESRRQVGDSNVTLEYLKKIHMYYESYVSQRTSHVIDGELDPEIISQQIKQILSVERNAEMSRTHEEEHKV